MFRVSALCAKMLARMEKHAGRERNVIQFYKETVRKQQDELKAFQREAVGDEAGQRFFELEESNAELQRSLAFERHE